LLGDPLRRCRCARLWFCLGSERVSRANCGLTLRSSGLTSNVDDVVDVVDVFDVPIFLVSPKLTFDIVWRLLPDFWGNAPYSTLTGIGVIWLYGFRFEIKVIA